MSIQQCILQIKGAAEAAGVELLDEEIMDILDVLERRLSKRGRTIGTMSDTASLIEEAREITRQAKINAAIQKRNRLINAKRYAEIKQRLNQFGDDAPEALEALMVGSLKFRNQGRVSVDGNGHAIMVDNAGVLLHELQKRDLVELFRSGDLDQDVYKELFDGFGSSGNNKAREIAEAVQKVQKRLLRRKNRAGANIRELANYVVRQRHDPMLMRDAGYDEWKAFILPRLDLEKTFKNLAPNQTEEDFLRGAYDALVSGNHQKTTALYGDDGKVDPLTAFKGPSNLAKKLSAERVLHFADGKASHEYANRFSRMSLSESVLAGITHDAQTIALMETFGTNPRAMFDRIIKDLEDASVGDTAKLDRIKKKKRTLENQFLELDGSTRARGAGRPVFFGVDFAGIAASWRMIQNMSKLGFATISSVSDIATKAHFIHKNTGRSLFESYRISMSDIFKNMSAAQQKETGYLLGVGVENFLGDVHARFGSNDSGPGKIAKAHQLFFKLNGMQWWNNAQKTGVARLLAADLANYANRPFSAIPEATQRNLATYGIGEREWGLFRGLDMKAADGRDYLSPSVVEQLTPERLDPILRANNPGVKDIKGLREAYLDELRTKLGNYYQDSADIAIPTPGARERAIMNQGTPRGTPLGEAIRMIMQLKGFPITYVTKGLSRQYYASEAGGRSGMMGIAQMMLGTTAMGYVAMAAKDIAKGREPRDVLDQDTAINFKTLESAFLQGGGAGIYGDFIFGEYNKYGQSFTQTLAGPTFGSVDDVARIWSSAMNGELGDAGEKALKFGIRNTPFINLFYTKAAMDYLFIYGMSEAMNPGFLARTERKFAKEYGQEFFLPPSQFAVGAK